MSGDPLIDAAVDVLRRGGLVAFPTETVYGLGADALNPVALERLYRVKGRPRGHPLIVHLGDPGWLEDWAREIPRGARRLAEALWPGPLTMILKRAHRVPDAVTGGQDTVGLRVPGHPLAMSLLRGFGSGIAAPSANRFGRVSPTTADHVRSDLGADVDIVLDGGPCAVGIESTIVDLSRDVPRLLRPGRITADELQSILGEPVRQADERAPRAPGTLEAHYAPSTPLAVVSQDEIVGAFASREEVALMAFGAPSTTHPNVRLFIAAAADPAAFAHDLYDNLRRLDAAGATRILVERPPDGPEWEGVRDRLRRAASSPVDLRPPTSDL